MNESLPVSLNAAQMAKKWLLEHFEANITAAIEGTNFSVNLICAIACQETAQRWLLWVHKYDHQTILQRCVFDASGDFPNTSRSAFPKNAAAFHDKYGDEFTDMLISEGNKMRAMPQPGNPDGYSSSHYLYKGYGIFQYDLQAVVNDEVFFRNKLWYNIDECCKRAVSELKSKQKKVGNDTWAIVKAYNGAGQAAENYSNNVKQFYESFA